jgi:hypothetical protein
MTGLWLALLVMTVAALFGFAWQARQGRLRVAAELHIATNCSARYSTAP